MAKLEAEADAMEAELEGVVSAAEAAEELEATARLQAGADVLRTVEARAGPTNPSPSSSPCPNPSPSPSPSPNP